MKKFAVVALSLIMAFSGVAPAEAFPSVSLPKIEAPRDVLQVQAGGDRGMLFVGPRRYYRGRYFGPRRYYGGRYYRNRYYGDRYYGDRYYRRHHHGSNAGAIIGGLALGAIIGGALAQPRYAPRRYYSGASAHVRWCYSRYRSYRAYDNTFQPYYGPRRQCISPY